MSEGPTQPAAVPSPAERRRWEQEQRLFNAALELPAPERQMLLDRECAGDPELRRQVESLLASHDGTGVLDRLADDVLAPTARVRATLPGDLEGQTIAHYTVGTRLGTGGMGVVHRAHDERLGRAIALKFLPPHLGSDEAAKRRFLLEARAAAALEHPNVCTIYEIGETPDGSLFIAMPLYDGETLQARLQRGSIAIQEAIGIAREIALGLAAAHRQGIVHRDVKPSNVMLLTDGRLKILDFGIAKVQDVTMTGSGVRLGTAAYMSPEQARGEPVDVRTDVWALGVVLYEMIAGRPPFEASTSHALMYAILTGDPAPLAEISGDVPRALDELVDSALAKTPARRLASMSAFVSALDAIGRGSIVEDVTGGPTAPERRRLTLLVTAIAGYASLVEQLDPADLGELVSRIRAEAVDVFRRHGGIVNEAIAGQIVAVFGIPASHEDDELRATRAALELHARVRAISTEATRRAGLSLAMQSGIDSGALVVQRLREGPRRYDMSGDAVQTAAHLSVVAGRDAVIISPECHRLVGPFVSSAPGEPVALKPGTPATATYRVLGDSGLQTRLDAVERAALTPYTGRDAELARVARAVERARDGQGGLVVVTGEAGMGKSRLLHELADRVRTSGMRVLKGRCQSYGGLSPYLPFVQVLRDALGIGPGDRPSPDEVAARLRALDASLDSVVPLYLHLLSLNDSEMPLPRHLQGEHLHAALLDAVAAIVMVLAHRSPLLLLLEDWHWADEASRDVVQHLAGILDSTAAALVVTSRPEGAGIAELSGRAEVVQLQPLDSAAAEAILSAMFRVPRVSPDLAARIHERTGGNPFFLEQVAHTLAEEGAVTTSGGVVEVQRDVDGLALPDTVQAVIRARLDRLSDDAREVLRVASVIGREFRRALLVAALDPSIDPARALDKLRAAGLIQQTHVLPEPAYRFKHVLTQEVAYGSLLEHQRRALHGAIGRALAQAASERVSEVAESLALHFSRAELWPEAIEYGRHAVARLRDLGQYGDALTMVERVRTWLPHLPENEARRTLTADILLEEERLCETVGQRGRQQQIVDELIALLAPHGSSPQLAQAYLRQGDVLTLRESFDAADRAFSTVLRLSREQNDAALERNCIRSIGLLRWHEGRHQEALEMAERALAIDRARADEAAIAGDLANLGNVLLSLGNHERARAVLEEALAMPVLADDLVRISYVLHNVANLHRALGDLDTALAYLRRADDLARSLPIQRSFHMISIAHIELQQGHVDEAVRTYEEAIELSRRARHANGLAQGLRALGELRLGLGQDAEALALLREAAALFAQLESRAAEMHLLAQVARLHERQDEWNAAREVWQNVRTLARTQGDRRVELDALEGLARTARQLEADRAAVIAAYEQALPFAEAIGDDGRAGALRNTLGILEWERGGYAAALAHYEAGLRLWRRAGNRAHEGLMLNSVGVTLARLQRYEEACTVLDQAAALNHASGERLLEAHALAALGNVSLTLGRRADAAGCYTRARDLRQALGDRDAERELSRRLADLGDPPPLGE